MDDKALEAAARACGDRYDYIFPKDESHEQRMSDIAQAAIKAYLEALPSDYGELVKRLSKDLGCGVCDKELDEAADAIDSLVATREAQSVVFEELGREFDIVEKRAEAAEARVKFQTDANFQALEALSELSKRAEAAEASWDACRQANTALGKRVVELEDVLRTLADDYAWGHVGYPDNPCLIKARAALEKADETS